jgi:SAM-dependent methyltransferase
MAYDASAYERGRPDFPRPAVEHLVRALRIDSSDVVLDLAAGTGKFTKELLPVAGTVLAIEPEPSMRAELARRLPDAVVCDGQAESMHIADDSVDAVTVAQAFHWFADVEVLGEIARILRPRGRLGLIWNVRDLSSPIQQALERIYAAHRASSPNYRGSGWRDVFTQEGPFTPLHQADFRHEHVVDQDGLLALVLSMSYMSRLPEDDRASVADTVASIFARYATPGNPPLIRVPYRTDVFWTEMRPVS